MDSLCFLLPNEYSNVLCVISNEYLSLLCVLLHRGVVIVDVPLSWLDINQCPQDYFVPNAFKDTARCHYDTTYVRVSRISYGS